MTWQQAVEDAVRYCIDQLAEFTSDDIWAYLDRAEFEWPEGVSPKNVGHELGRLAKARVIEKTNRTRRSERKERHGGSVAVWVAAGLAWAQVDAVPVPRHLREALEAEAAAAGMDLIELVAKKLQRTRGH